MTLALGGRAILPPVFARRNAMTKTGRALGLLSALTVGLGASAMAATPADRMTQGKLAADLGDRPAAEQAFASLASDGSAPEGLRAEALVRLGVVQRALGKTQASTAAFEQAMQSPARDAEVTRLLTLALAGVTPDRRRWVNQWSKVRFAPASGAAGHRSAIKWPGPGPQGVREAFPARDPVTFDLEDVSLMAFLHHFLTPWRPDDPNCQTCHWPGPRTTPGFEAWPESYQPPAAVQRLDFVIHSVTGGFADVTAGPRVTVKASGMPWNELFESVLASNGLGFVIEKNLLFIAPAENLSAIERFRGRTYGGQPINLNFLAGRLEELLFLFSDITGFRLVLDESLKGRGCPPGTVCPSWYMTLRMSERPSMAVLDLVLIANDLAATPAPAPADAKPGTKALRICRPADARGDALDLSRLVPPGPAQ
jgi:hypothetical protein